jgi:hypothetical protein
MGIPQKPPGLSAVVKRHKPRAPPARRTPSAACSSTALHARRPPVHRLSTGGDHGASKGVPRHFGLILKSKKPQVTGYVTWGFVEPPVGFEPTTYALQVRERP